MAKGIIIGMDELNGYTNMMLNDNSSLQREGIQRLFERLANGYRILGMQKEKLEPILLPLLNSPSNKVRKWSYHLAILLSTEKIIESCLKRLKEETDIENIQWLIAVVARNYKKSEVLNIIRKASKVNPIVENISELQINASAILYTQDKNFCDINVLVEKLRKSDPKVRSWLTKLYAYDYLAKKQGIFGCVTENDMLDLIQDGDIGLQEYGMWALCLNKSGQIQSNPLPQNFYQDCYADTKKWLFRYIVKFPDISRDKYYIQELLKTRKELNRSGREGLISALDCVPFNEAYSNEITCWFDEETSQSVQYFILLYMLKNASKDKSEDFLKIIDILYCLESNQNIRKTITDYINSCGEDKLSIQNNRVVLNNHERIAYYIEKIEAGHLQIGNNNEMSTDMKKI